MKNFIVTSVVGKDRPGFVNLITSRIREIGGNVELQRSTRMAEEFAAIILFSVEGGDSEVAAAVEAVQGIRAEDTLIHARSAVTQGGSGGVSGTSAELTAVGADQQGIIDEVTLLLFRRQINIESMNYDVDSAPMTGQSLFRMEARLSIPDSVDIDGLKDELRQLELALNFDILFRHPSG
jgi:glycine cleavage system regulatory protein